MPLGTLHQPWTCCEPPVPGFCVCKIDLRRLVLCERLKPTGEAAAVIAAKLLWPQAGPPSCQLWDQHKLPNTPLPRRCSHHAALSPRAHQKPATSRPCSSRRRPVPAMLYAGELDTIYSRWRCCLVGRNSVWTARLAAMHGLVCPLSGPAQTAGIMCAWRLDTEGAQLHTLLDSASVWVHMALAAALGLHDQELPGVLASQAACAPHARHTPASSEGSQRCKRAPRGLTGHRREVSLTTASR